MPRLYEGEEVQSAYYYDAKHGSDQEHRIREQQVEAEAEILENGRAAEELLHSRGWQLLKQAIDGDRERLTQALVESKDTIQDQRLKAAIKVYGNIEGFIHRLIFEGKAILDNREVSED